MGQVPRNSEHHYTYWTVHTSRKGLPIHGEHGLSRRVHRHGECELSVENGNNFRDTFANKKFTPWSHHLNHVVQGRLRRASQNSTPLQPPEHAGRGDDPGRRLQEVDVGDTNLQVVDEDLVPRLESANRVS